MRSALARRLVDPQRVLVVAREDGGRAVRQVEQFAAAPETALVLEVPVPHQGLVEGDAGPLERRAVPVDPGPAAQVVLRPADGGDPAVPEAEQVLGGGQAAR